MQLVWFWKHEFTDTDLQHFPWNSSEQPLQGAASSTAATPAPLPTTVPSFIVISAAKLCRLCSLQSQCRETAETVKTWQLPNMKALLNALLPGNVFCLSQVFPNLNALTLYKSYSISPAICYPSLYALALLHISTWPKLTNRALYSQNSCEFEPDL